MNGGNPPVAAALQGLDKDGAVGGIAESIAQTFNGAADGAVKIDKDVFRPELLPELIAGNNPIRAAQQELQSAERQVLDLDVTAILPQLTRTKVGLEHAKANHGLRGTGGTHK